MGKTFHLEILTPERMFFSGEATALCINGLVGELVILKGHAPMLTAIPSGNLSFEAEGEERRDAVHSDGFLEVTSEEVLLFLQSCENPDEIDVIRAQMAIDRAAEKLRQKQSIIEQKHAEASLARAMIRLRAKRR